MLIPNTDGSGEQTVYKIGTVDAGLNLQGRSLNPGPASYNPSNLSQHTAAEYLLSQGGVLSSSWLNPIGAFYDSQSAVSTNDHTWKQAA